MAFAERGVRVYRQSIGFWLQRGSFLLMCLAMLVAMYFSKNGGRGIMPFWAAVTLFIFYAIFRQQPIAVEINCDSFIVRFLWKRQSYPFSNVTYVIRDEVMFPRSGIIQTVKVGFSYGPSLQLMFPAVRDELCEDLAAAWHAATEAGRFA